MSIVIMAGYPYSGKTEFSKLLVAELAKRNKTSKHLTPHDYVCDEYWSLQPDNQRSAMIEAWGKCTNEMVKSLQGSDTIIYDTCGSNLDVLSKHIPIMKLNKHKVIYVFIASHIDECKQRAGDKWVTKEALNRYQTEFNKSVYAMKRLCDRFFFIKNTNDVNKINLKNNASKIAEIIDGQISGIHEPKPIHGSDNRSRQTDDKRTQIRKNRTV